MVQVPHPYNSHIHMWFHIFSKLIEKQNRHISASEVNVYLSAGGYLGDKFQDKYFFVWPGSQRFNLDSCNLVLDGSFSSAWSSCKIMIEKTMIS